MLPALHEQVDAGEKHVQPHIERQDAVDMPVSGKEREDRVKRARILDQDAGCRRRGVNIEVPQHPGDVRRVHAVEEDEANARMLPQRLARLVLHDHLVIGEMPLQHLREALHQEIRLGDDHDPLRRMVFTAGTCRFGPAVFGRKHFSPNATQVACPGRHGPPHRHFRD